MEQELPAVVTSMQAQAVTSDPELDKDAIVTSPTLAHDPELQKHNPQPCHH